MNKIALEDEPVFILHLRKYSETSLILDCLSKNYGCFCLIAKGVLRQGKTNQKEVPRLFQAYKINALIKSDMGTLTHLESTYLWAQPQGQRWFVGNYMNELMLKLIPKLEPMPSLYAEYVKTLDCLVNGEEYQYALLKFEKNLLEVLGYGSDLEYEAESRERIETDRYYLFNPSIGLTQCAASRQHALSGEIVRALQWDDDQYFAENSAATLQAKRLVRMALKYQLGDIKLKTIDVMREVLQMKHDTL